MNDKAASDKDDKTPMGGELVIPIMALLFTLYYFWTILDVPWSAQVSAFFVGSILIVLLFVLFFRVAGLVKRGEASLKIGPLFDPTAFVPKRLALLGLTVGFIFVVQYLGFTITIFLFLSSAMLLLGNGQKKGLSFPCQPYSLSRVGLYLSGPLKPDFRPDHSKP